MKIEMFFDNFELLTDAPNTVAKLREIILQLAVCGKLLPQNLSDEPASVLLKKIKAEKENLVKEKKIREEKNLLKIKKDEIAYEVPQTWVLVRIGDVLNVIRGASPRPKGDPRYFAFERTPYHWVKISDIRKYSQGIFLENTDEFLTKEGADKSVVLEKGTLILTNSATIGVPVVLGIDGGCIHDGYLVFPYVNDNYLDKKYLYYYFLQFQSQLKERAFGGAQLNLNTNIVKNAPFALPPLAEQKRIVEKCDRLLSLCNQIEVRQQQRQESIVRMNESAIAHLLSSQNPDEFRQHWQRICNNFDLLYSIPETIPKLRQAILQLAVQGKLVRQDPKDEPASVLLERIKAEKAKLGTKKKIRAPQDQVITEVDDVPFEIPSHWLWLKIDDFYDVSGGIQKTPKRTPISNFFSYLRVANVHRGKLDLSQLEYFELFEGELERWRLEQNDLLIVEGNGSENEIGRCAVWNGEIHNCVHQNHIIRVRPVGHSGQLFTLLFFNSPSGMAEMRDLAITTSGLYSLSVGKIREILVPVPPLAEQKRIVAKCDRLMSLCDTLEAKLKEARSHSEMLMEVAAKQVLVA
jgi:type I restriction enzyme S subunit